MQFDRPFRVSIFLLVLAGAITLGLAEMDLEHGSSLFLILAVTSVVVAWGLVERPNLEHSRRDLGAEGRGSGEGAGAQPWKPRGIPRWLANSLAVLACGYAFVDASQISDGLLAIAHLLLVIQMIKLFQRKTDRDWMQLALLSLMHLGTAAALTIQLSFAVGLLIYLIVGAWAMLFYTLRKEAAECRAARGQVVMGGTRNLLALMLLMVGMVVFVIASTGVLFLVFPRTGQELFSYNLMTRRGVIGFSDNNMTLGQIASLADNPSPAMTVRVEGGMLPVDHLRMRGTVYDEYTRGSWRNSFKSRQWQDKLYMLPPGGRAGANDWRRRKDRHLRAQPLLDGSLMDTRIGGRATAQVLDLEVILEPLASRCIFTHTTTIALLGGSGTFDTIVPYEEKATGVVVLNRKVGRFRYMMTCHLGSTNVDSYGFDPGRVAPLPARERFLQLPDEILESARIPTLAREITADAETPMEKASALVQYLRDEYHYSTQNLGAPRGVEPVERFLFERKTGHCEYFASALALLLRSVGIPARVVNGFVGGEYNDLAEVYTLRQRDAHAWVEAHFDGVSKVVQPGGHDVISTGWITLDPSPMPAFETTGSGLTGLMQKVLEFFRVKWDAHVLGFEQRHQQHMFRGVASGTDTLVKRAREFMRSARGTGGGRGSVGGLIAALCLGVGVLLLAPSFLRRRRGREDASSAAVSIVAFYAAWLEVLDRRGMPRRPGETARELAERVGALEALSVRGQEAARGLAECYNDVRFGGRGLSPEQDERVHEWLSTIEEELAAAAAEEAPVPVGAGAETSSPGADRG